MEQPTTTTEHREYWRILRHDGKQTSDLGIVLSERAAEAVAASFTRSFTEAGWLSTIEIVHVS